MCVLCVRLHVCKHAGLTSLAVGAANLDGSQIVQELLELGVREGWPPGEIGRASCRERV